MVTAKYTITAVQKHILSPTTVNKLKLYLFPCSLIFYTYSFYVMSSHTHQKSIFYYSCTHDTRVQGLTGHNFDGRTYFPGECRTYSCTVTHLTVALLSLTCVVQI